MHFRCFNINKGSASTLTAGEVGENSYRHISNTFAVFFLNLTVKMALKSVNI